MNLDEIQIGYCTNVHAGNDLATTKANLEEHALRVKSKFSPDSEMGIGLWLSNSAAEDLMDKDRLSEFRDWLAERGLLPFTFNGFPYGDFHQEVVKHSVYLPTWAEKKRLDYTLHLIDILHQLLPEGIDGSISTLPIAWPEPPLSHEFLTFAAQNLLAVAKHLEKLESETGRLITLCIEPEPGCFLQTSTDVLNFFEQYLLESDIVKKANRYLTVCHDVCHAAVVFESQRDVLNRYWNHGIQVGKVQVSSAVELDGQQMEPAQYGAAIEQLSTFVEERYLHQTNVRRGTTTTFYEDLKLALAENSLDQNLDQAFWRVHFHVPIYLEQFGNLAATRSDILECLKEIQKQPSMKHFEVETYAWNVLPQELQKETLSDGIAAELDWFRKQISS